MAKNGIGGESNAFYPLVTVACAASPAAPRARAGRIPDAIMRHGNASVF